MRKFKKVLAAVLAGTMAVASMVCSAFAADGFEMSGTSVTLNDGGIRINVWNPWGADNTRAVKSMAPIDGAKAVTVTVKVTGMEADGINSFNMWLNGASNVEGNAVSYWENDGTAKDGCQSTIVNVTKDGEYKVTLTSETAWAKGDNNFLMVGTDIDKDAWGALNDGEGDAGLLSITNVEVTEPAEKPSESSEAPSESSNAAPSESTGAGEEVPTGESSTVALTLLVAACAIVGVCVAVSVKKSASEK